MKKVIFHILLACILANSSIISAQAPSSKDNTIPKLLGVAALVGMGVVGYQLWQQNEKKRARDPEVQKERLDIIKLKEPNAYEVLNVLYKEKRMQSLGYWNIFGMCAGLRVKFLSKPILSGPVSHTVSASYGLDSKCYRSIGSPIAPVIVERLNRDQNRNFVLHTSDILIDHAENRIVAPVRDKPEAQMHNGKWHHVIRMPRD